MLDQGMPSLLTERPSLGLPVRRTWWPAAASEPEPAQDQCVLVTWEHQGLICVAVQSPDGNWSARVGIPPDHPAFGLSSDVVERLVDSGLQPVAGDEPTVVPEAVDPGLRWIECGAVPLGQFGVLRAALAPLGKQSLLAVLTSDERSRMLTFVTCECERLAEMLVVAALLVSDSV